eukprot:117132-Chlamydomonas_euryale.AAC.3
MDDGSLEAVPMAGHSQESRNKSVRQVLSGLEELQATVFFEKPLTSSDASGSGRVVIPKVRAGAPEWRAEGSGGGMGQAGCCWATSGGRIGVGFGGVGQRRGWQGTGQRPMHASHAGISCWVGLTCLLGGGGQADTSCMHACRPSPSCPHKRAAAPGPVRKASTRRSMSALNGDCDSRIVLLLPNSW